MYVIAASTLSLQMTALSENVTYIMRKYLYVKDFYEFMDEYLEEHGGEVEGPSKEDSLALSLKR